MQAGKLRHRVQIQENSPTFDGTGRTDNWATVATRWASIRPRNVESQPADNNITHVVEMRYYSGLTSESRILYGARVLNIAAPVNYDERDEMTQILCTEKTQNG